MYSWDAATRRGSIQSFFDQGCDGSPGGTDTYAFAAVTHMTRLSICRRYHVMATLVTSRRPGPQAAPCQLARRTVAGGVTACVLAAIAAPSMKTAVAEGPLHHVRYTTTAETAGRADIYYRDTDPPDFAAHSHNPYQFSPRVDAELGPGHIWILDVMINDPARWAMVVATSGADPVSPRFHCTLEVDGAVAVVNQGPKGAVCSTRTW
jgi:hypothetical protein